MKQCNNIKSMNKIFTLQETSELEGFLVNTSDEFLSEYTTLNRLSTLAGFTGSSGILIVNKNKKSAFFTDGRYLLQAKQELNKEEIEVLDYNNFENYLSLNFQTLILGIDTKLHSLTFISRILDLKINLKFLTLNPVDVIFGHEKFKSKKSNIFDFKLTDISKEVKLEKIFKILEEENVDFVFIFNLEEVNWLFNIRGDFSPHTPVANRFAIVSRETQKIFFIDELEEISKVLQGKRVLVFKNISYYIYSFLQSIANVVIAKQMYLENFKSIKTPFEIECIKNAHKEDSSAMEEFLKWIKKANLEEETEYTIGQKLLDIRKNKKGFICESFSSIVGLNENGAIIHYRAKEDSAKKITNGILLVDSGGQYYDEKNKICATTDITRTIAIGEQAQEQKRIYTLVLKGHIALACAVFPIGTTGASLDILARKFLYENGLDYKHGTGHGVGYFLSVHEGSCGISKNYHTPLLEGMIISNEPGCYLEGKFGVRIESLLLVKKAKFEGFLDFETLTKVEIEKSFLDYDLLTDAEIEWLTNYHSN